MIYNGDDQNTLDLINKYKGPVKFVNYKEFLSKLPVLSVPGEHNRFDAAAALAVANILDISEEISRKSLKKFEGTWRRLEKKDKQKMERLFMMIMRIIRQRLELVFKL